METRVLTLFDDEDFSPKEEAPKKNEKKTAVKAIAVQEEEAYPSEAAAEGTAAGSTDQPVPQNDLPEAMADPASHEKSENPVVEENPGASFPDPEEIPMQVIVPLERETAETLSEERDTDIKAAEEELNKQILSELIQLDYTALIHKDYPFDVKQAKVIERDKEIKVPLPEAAAIEEPFVETTEEEEEEIFEEVVPLPEWNLDKKYYTIGEVAQLFTVNTSHIRFWTNEFKLRPRTTRKGDRLYSPKDIAELRLIHHLVKEKKHTIKGAREKLKAEKTGVHQKLDLKESLTGLRDMLVQIKEQL